MHSTKTLHTLKANVFKLPDNEYIQKIVFRIWTVFPGSSQLQFWSISNIPYYNTPSLEFPCPHWHLCKIFPWPTKIPLQKHVTY